MNSILSRLQSAIVLAVLSATGAVAQVEEVAINRDGPHEARVSRVASVINEKGEAEPVTSSWVQLEDGLNYWDVDARAWKESKAEIEIVAGGAVALKGQHRAVFSSNVNDPEGALDVEIMGSVRLRSSVLALRYFDAASGNDAVIATVHDAQGELLPPNQIIYRKAFDQINADVIYTYRKRGVEADVVLREVPAPPSDFGLNPDTTRLEVLTEFFEAPMPQKQVRIMATVEDPVVRARVAEPDWVDEELDFGVNKIGQGRAFAWSAREAATENPEKFPAVAKRWVVTPDGRTLLIESVDLMSVLDELLALPGAKNRLDQMRGVLEARTNPGTETFRQRAMRQWAAGDAKPKSLDSTYAHLPGKRQRAAAKKTPYTGIQLAARDASVAPGLVLDWTSMSAGQSNFTFRGDETYHITGAVTMSGTTTLEGGAVIKYPRYNPTNGWTAIIITGAFSSATRMYSPAVFTANDDNTVGATVVAGVPGQTNLYSANALRFSNTGLPITIEHIRVRYCQHSIYLEGNNPDTTIRNAQFKYVRWAVTTMTNQLVKVQNILADTLYPDGVVFAAFGGVSAPFSVENITMRNCPGVTYNGVIGLTNSILAGFTYTNGVSGRSNYFSTSATGVFETVGEGTLYLPSTSPLRNAGTTSISMALADDLKITTTAAPLLLTTPISVTTVLGPQAMRDQDAPDLGYHYPPLDYCLSSTLVTNCMLTLTNGVAVGVYGTEGLLLGPSSTLLSEGTPTRLNRLVRFNTAMDGVNNWGTTGSQFDLLKLVASGSTGTAVPAADLRFTEFSHLALTPSNAANARLLVASGGNRIRSLGISHCQVNGLRLEVGAPTSEGQVIGLTNTAFVRSALYVADSAGVPSNNVFIYNNLFLNGDVTFSNADANAWVIKDNLFDALSLTSSGSHSASHNGFRTGLASIGTSTKTGLSGGYLPGPLGPYYLPYTGSLSALTNAGSRNADTAGLYHFTTRPDQKKEANSVVDIGLHYASTGASGVGLVAAYRFDEGTGTSAADSSGSGNTGTLNNGAYWVPGRRGTAVAFDGSNDYVAVADTMPLRLTNALTIATWVKKFSESGANWQPFVSKQTSLATRNYWLGDWAGTNGISVGAYSDTNGVDRSAIGTSHSPTDRWYHLAWTWDGTKQSIYIDGVLDGTNTGSAYRPASSSAAIGIGGYSYTTPSMHGALDEVLLYNRALGAAEIAGLMGIYASDTDGDGAPDYWEDKNGNGTSDAGESDWTASGSGLGGAAGLVVHTPLK